MYKGIERLKEYTTIDEVKEAFFHPYEKLIKELDEVYIFGAKSIGEAAYDSLIEQGYKVKGFVDNNPQIQGKHIKGKLVYSLEEIKSNTQSATIIICTLLYGAEIEEQLKLEGIEKFIHYQVLNLYDKDMFIWKNSIVDGMLEELINYKEEYIKIFQSLADEKSKQIMDCIINYRLTFDLKYAKKAYNISGGIGESEYFDKEIIQLKDEVFVDGGAYKGETSFEFSKKAGINSKILIFEPDCNLMEESKKTLEGISNIKYFNGGLAEKTQKLKFNNTGDMGGKISNEGNVEIQVYSLDNIAEDKVTFIKLDVEGYEKEAILGASKVIKYNAPKLAISAYHKVDDIRELYKLILSINNRYKVYLRHYSNGYYETDLYFIPIID